jgi:hypothetical protein
MKGRPGSATGDASYGSGDLCKRRFGFAKRKAESVTPDGGRV